MILVCMSLFVFLLARMILLSSRRFGPRVIALGIIGLCCCLSATSRATAQAVGGSISGTVKDKQGSAISDVTAVFTNTKTHKSVTVPVKAEETNTKYDFTSVDQATEGSTVQINAVKLGGTKTKLGFSK